jgi:gas vesicle protein
MEEKKKNSKFVTTILIGGALGSLAALLFRGQVRRNESPVPTKKQKNTFFQRLLGK